jgi:TolB-like protein/Flp pilus assembly protein TadD
MRKRWQQITRLFTDALAVEEPVREAWLQHACDGDGELFDEVNSLLNAYTSSGLENLPGTDLRDSALQWMEMHQKSGKKIGSFELQELAGAGGMGVVYRARDTRLNRDVAVKFPPVLWSRNERAKERFLHEARAAASLDHPNICTIYESGELPDGTLYIAMAYYEGETLQNRLKRGPLVVEDAANLAVQTARGLEAAHARGLVHRDIKPANLMITGGGILKILDFGIARSNVTGITRTGHHPGTAAYMAPEQAGGIVDGRADLWSLGVVLYEMIAGIRPQEERPGFVSIRKMGIPDPLIDLILRLLEPAPEDRYQKAGDVVEEIQAIFGSAMNGVVKGNRTWTDDRVEDEPGAGTGIVRDIRNEADAGMEKENDNGLLNGEDGGVGSLYHGGADAKAGGVIRVENVNPDSNENGKLRGASVWQHPLGRWLYAGIIVLIILSGSGLWIYLQQDSASGRHPEEKAGPYTLAVLPFYNMSGDTEDEYFSDGMTEDLLAWLSRNSDFRVISHSSVIRFKDRDRNLQEIGKILGATHLVEGSVRRSGEKLRITARLIDAKSSHHIWAGQYDREMEDIFTIQADIARLITEKLEGHLQIPAEMTALSDINPKAHDHYQKGRYYWHKRTETGMNLAIRHFRDAVNIDPDYSKAWEGLADAYAIAGFYDILPPEESFPEARDAARHALELKPGSSSAWATLGYVALYYDWDTDWSEAAFRRAIMLDPESSKAHQWYADMLVATGRFTEAERELLHAQELDPLSLIAKAALGCVYYHTGRYEEALEYLHQTLELDPDFAISYLWSGMALEIMGHYDESLEMYEQAVSRSGGSGISIAALARMHALRGEKELAESILTSLITSGRHIPSYEIGKVYMGLEKLDEAVIWLERAIGERSHSMVLMNVDPQIQKHRENPSIAGLIARVYSDPGPSE